MFVRSLLLGLVFFLFQCNLYAQNCITINEQPDDPVIITNNNTVLTNNTSLTLNIDATSSSTLTYQWQIFNTITNNWEDILESSEFSGTTTDTLLIENINSVNNNDLIRVFIETSDNSCTPISIELTITKINLTIYNFFTPNDDGFNDTFTIEGILNPLFQNNELKIFNRWGNAVYEKVNYENDWDGTANSSFSIKTSKRVPAGTYFYTLDLNYKNIKLSGWVYVKL